MSKPAEFWTSDETAAYLKRHQVTLRKWRHEQRPDQPPYIKVGAAVLYRPEDVERWAKAHKRRPNIEKNRDPGRLRGRPGPQ